MPCERHVLNPEVRMDTDADSVAIPGSVAICFGADSDTFFFSFPKHGAADNQ
jgi:hypothetical protein